MKTGFTCSAFDLCHAGHMLLFKEAKDHCDYLVVGLQDDPSADNNINLQYRGKLKNKPIMNLEERKIVLESIKYIDEIFVYSNEEDLYKNIQRLKREGKYDIRFIGDDYRGKHYTGDDVPHEIYYVNRDHGYSTTALRERVYSAECEKIAQEKSATEKIVGKNALEKELQKELTPKFRNKVGVAVKRVFGPQSDSSASPSTPRPASA